MSLEQWIGVWVIAAGLVMGFGTAALVIAAAIWINAQEDRRYGMRRRRSRAETGRHGRTDLAGDGSPAGAAAARVGRPRIFNQ
jgi:hypothetical protein